MKSGRQVWRIFWELILRPVRRRHGGEQGKAPLVSEPVGPPAGVPPAPAAAFPQLPRELAWRYNLDALEEMLGETGLPATREAAQALPLDSLPALQPIEVRERIHTLNHIPVLKSVSQSFQLASRSRHTSLSELGVLVRRDPGLHTKILRMINSSFFRLETEVTDIEHAMVLLGLDRIRFMAQTLGAVSELNRMSAGFDLRHLWSHSFSCGMIAEHLVNALELPELVHAYSAGLLHDVGKIILASLYPEPYRALLRLSQGPEFDLGAAERRVFGCDHEQAGAIFAEAQKLPHAIAAAMAHHSRPAAAPEAERETAVILFLANVFAKRSHLGFSGNPAQVEEAALLDALALLPVSAADPAGQLFRLQASVTEALPVIRQEVEDLLRLTFGRSLPHTPIPLEIPASS